MNVRICSTAGVFGAASLRRDSGPFDLLHWAPALPPRCSVSRPVAPLPRL